MHVDLDRLLTRSRDEHYKRFAECLFFELMAKGPPPKKVRGKAARATNMSRLSIQSVATTFSEAQTIADETANHDDSVMTTASVMTQGGTKKPARGRKPAAAKTKKAKAKKAEPVEILEDEQDGDVPPQPPPKPTRGRKRASDAVDDPNVTKAEAPAPKKRATRKASEAIADTVVMAPSEEAEMEDAPAPPPKQPAGRKKGRASTTKATTRKTSGSSVKSKASTASLRAQAEEADLEIERQLQADLERPLTDEEYHTADSESEREKAGPAPIKGKKTADARKGAQRQENKKHQQDYAMFDPAPIHKDDDADVSAELKALEDDMGVQSKPEQLEIPKKGKRAAGTRKVSKQTKKAKEEAQPPPPTDEDDIDELSLAMPEETGPEGIEDHDASSATVITKPAPARASTGRPRGRPKKSSTGPEIVAEEPQPALEPVRKPEPEVQDDQEPKFDVLHDTSEPEAEVQEHNLPEEHSLTLQSPDAATSPPTQSHSPIRTNKSLPPVPPPSSPPQVIDEQEPPPTTPRAIANRPIPPTHSAKQATISPTPSPQSSDAENQPPSSSTAPPPTAKRLPLPVVSLLPAATPHRNPASSPTRRNIIGGIQSAQPWKPVDLDVVFALVGQTEGDGAEGDVERLLMKGGGELSTPERNMTVEEWVFYNAGLAEEMLRRECEGMVGVFEREGKRAMGVLEGLVVE